MLNFTILYKLFYANFIIVCYSSGQMISSQVFLSVCIAYILLFLETAHLVDNVDYWQLSHIETQHLRMQA